MAGEVLSPTCFSYYPSHAFRSIEWGLGLLLLWALNGPHLLTHLKPNPTSHSPTTLCGGDNCTTSASALISCCLTVQNWLTFGMAKALRVWDICLVWDEGRQEHINSRLDHSTDIPKKHSQLYILTWKEQLS